MDTQRGYDANPFNAVDPMIESGQDFYLPASQRPHSWDDGHIDRLIDDVNHGGHSAGLRTLKP